MKITEKSKPVVQLVGVALAILMVAIVFLPFSTATAEYRNYLLEYSDGINVQEINMTNAQVVSLSLFEYARLYGATLKTGYYKEQSIFGIVIIIIFAGMAMLTLLFSATKKSIPQIIFTCLTMLAFYINHIDFSMRRVIPSSNYDWGLANWLVYVVGVLLIADAIVMIVIKSKEKKLA